MQSKACGLGLELAKLILVGANFAFFIGGCIILGLGIFALEHVGPAQLQNFISLPQLGIGTIIVGVFIAIISFMGCFGSARENRLLLGCYFFFLLLIFITSIGLAFAAFGQIPLIDNLIDDGWQKLDNSTKEWVYNEWDCCGYYKPDNSSFCRGVSKNSTIHVIGCRQALLVFFQTQFQVVEISGALFGSVLFLGLVFTLCVCTAIPTKKQIEEEQKRSILEAAQAISNKNYETI